MESMKKGTAIFFAALVTVSFFLFATGKIPVRAFWLIVALSAIVAYWILPRWKT